jgi:hypothetical protein
LVQFGRSRALLGAAHTFNVVEGTPGLCAGETLWAHLEVGSTGRLDRLHTLCSGDVVFPVLFVARAWLPGDMAPMHIVIRVLHPWLVQADSNAFKINGQWVELNGRRLTAGFVQYAEDWIQWQDTPSW